MLFGSLKIGVKTITFISNHNEKIFTLKAMSHEAICIAMQFLPIEILQVAVRIGRFRFD